MQAIYAPMGWLMKLCYDLLHNYGLAIILFTLLTKLILFPMSLWVHRNGIKLVQIEPAVNRLKIKYFGDQDRIADETSALYKREHYNPFTSVIPVVVQLFLLIGLIQIIYHPMTYVLRFPSEVISALLQTVSTTNEVDITSGAAEMLTIHAMQNTAVTAECLAVPGMTQSMMDQALGMNMQFLAFDLSAIPAKAGGILYLIPLLAALASVALSLCQSRLNPLQTSQGKIRQLATTGFSVGISLILGFLVPAGVGFYWICSNLFTIAQQPILNLLYPPSKYIDYDDLETTRKELKEYTYTGSKEKRNREVIQREKVDFKRFFSVGNKHLVFYSESNGFYKYFEKIIEYILANSSIKIHYVTSDPNDNIFELAKKEKKIEPYYIGEKKLITLFLKLEADVMVMTMSDLDNYQYKRSYFKQDINYVYLFHYPLSTHMVLHTGALRHYDTILCVGEFQFEEIRQTEALFGDPEQELIACGYGQLEKLYDAYQHMDKIRRPRPKVLIAPSWQQDNILDNCLDNLLGHLLNKGFDITIRPHPEYIKRYSSKMNDIVNRYSKYMGGDLFFELDFSSNTSIFDSDVVISDWSGTAYEFAFVTEKPCIFIDTPMKVNNPDYQKITVPPLEISLRDQVGIRMDPDDLSGISEAIRKLLNDEEFSGKIRNIRMKYIANFGHSGEVGGKYIISAVKDQISKRKKQNHHRETEKS